jgi:hypothetical protein
MSFEKKTVAELKKIARISGIDLGDAKKKSEILQVFAFEGLTEESYESMLVGMYKEADVKEESKVIIKDETKSKVLMTMRHDRAALRALGYEFTKDKPYILVDKKDADIMIKKISHEIREATPEEAASFYGAK